MTNEEKTDILVSDYYINESDSPEGAQGVRYGAEMMAEWKDKQFKEYLGKLKVKYFKEYRKLASKSNDEYVPGELEAYGRLCMLLEIINELFGGE